MADVENSDIIRLGAVLKVGGLFDVVNVFHLYISSGGGLGWALANADFQEYVDQVYQNIDTYLHTGVAGDSIQVANVTQATVFGSIAFNPAITGSDAGSILPLGVCCLTWARTYKARVQMRKYWSGFTEAQLDGGSWTSTLENACLAAMTDVVGGLTGSNGLVMVGVAYNRSGGTYTIGQSISSSDIPAYQRRRKQGVGS